MDTITATLYSPAYSGLISRDDPNYGMHHCNKYDNRFGTSYIPPLTREQHSNREYLGAPYRFANDREDSFESNPPTNLSPSPSPEDGPRLFWADIPSENDADTDWQLAMLRTHYKQLQEEMREDTLLAQRQRAELHAVWKDPRYYPQPGVQIPLHLQQPNDGNQRRGRGRPRKERNAVVMRDVPQGGPLPSKRQLARGNGTEEEPMKRGRGRPRKDGMIAAKRQRTAAAPDAANFGGRYGSGGGGKWKPGEAPWGVASPAPLIKVEEVGDDLAVRSSPTEEEGPASNSSPTEGCAYKPSTRRAAEVRAARDGKEKEPWIPSGDEDEEMSPFNIFETAVLPTRATRSGREFAG